MARRPYTTLVRPFRDSDTAVPIRWYPARPEDGTLPFPSKICSLDWMTDPHTHEGVGEVYGASRNYNRARPIGGPPRDHVCGTRDEHGLGGVYDPTKPPMLYQPSGLPLCCEPGRREAFVPAPAVPASVAITGPVYRSAVTAVVAPQSYLIRDTPRYTTVCVCPPAVTSVLLADDPYHATTFAIASPESVATADGVYHSEVLAVATPEGYYEEPHATCPLAVDWELGTVLPRAVQTGENWYYLGQPASGTVTHFARLLEEPQPMALHLLHGPDCDDLDPVSLDLLSVPWRYEWTAPGGPVWLKILSDGFVPTAESLEWRSGPAVYP